MASARAREHTRGLRQSLQRAKKKKVLCTAAKMPAPDPNSNIPAPAGEAKAGSQYKGEYKGGLKNGNGAATYADGGEYRGGWKDGKKSGQGVYYYPNGDSYVGEWADGQRQGKGTYSFAACKSQYVGVWKAGAMTSGVWVRHDQSKVQINA